MSKSVKRKNGRKKQKGKREDIILFILPFIISLVFILILSIVGIIIDLQKALNFSVITAIFSASMFLTSFVSASKKREKGLVTGIIYNLPSILVLEFISLTLNGFSVDFNFLLSFVTMIISSALGGITGVNKKQKFKR